MPSDLHDHVFITGESGEGEAEGAEGGAEGGGAPGAVLVAEGVEAGAVVHFGEVGEFVADYVVAQFLREEDEVGGEADFAGGSAGAEHFGAARYAPPRGVGAHLRGDLAGAGQE